MRFLMEEIMVQIEKIHTDFWTFTVFDKFIEYGKIRDLYTDSKTPTKKVSV